MQHSKDITRFKKDLFLKKEQLNSGNIPELIVPEAPLSVLTGLLIRTFGYIINIKLRDGFREEIG